MLCLFNGYLEDYEIIELFKEAFCVNSRESKEMFNRIISKCEYILEKTDSSTRELEPYINNINKKFTVNFSRIRAIVPNTLVISLTRDCFMQCEYCYAGANYEPKASEKNSLSKELIEKIIKEARLLRIKHIDLTGGDPFARDDIFEVLNIFKKYDITVSLSTKKIFSKNDIENLKKYRNILEIQLSLDTLNNEIQEKLVNKKNYASDMIKVVEELCKNKFNVKVNSVVTSLNINQIIDLSKYLDKIEVKKHIISPYSNNMWNKYEYLFPRYEQYNKLYNNIKNLKLSIDIEYPRILQDIEKKNIEEMYIEKKELTCKAALDGFVINHHGLASICERLSYNEEFSVGDIKNSTILEIWNSAKMKKFLNLDIENFKGTKCYKCKEKDYCLKFRGICHVHALILNNSMYAPDYLCKFNENENRIF